MQHGLGAGGGVRFAPMAMRETPPLFGYGTGVSLRAPDRRGSRSPLLVIALLLITAVVAGLAFAGFLWLATADYGSVFASALNVLTSLSTRIPTA